MIRLLNGKIGQFKTLVNPLLGLPTPHQRSVNRIISRLSDIEKSRDYYGFTYVPCVEFLGVGEIFDSENQKFNCPNCQGYGNNFEFLGKYTEVQSK